MAMQAPTDLFVGVDGGGTKTAISLSSSTGTILASVTAAGSNPNSVGDATAARTVAEGIKAVVASIGGDVANIRSVVLSISGCNSAADGLRVSTWLTDLLPHSWSTLPGASVSAPPAGAVAGGTLVHAYNDSIAALVSGTGGKLEGVVLIAGTGMICRGVTATGDEWVAGGNGALMDGGSGYAIGTGVCRAVFQAYDGMGQPTPLVEATLKAIGKERVEQLVDWIYSDTKWERMASLAPLALKYGAPAAAIDASADGVTAATPARAADPVALGIVRDAATFLAGSIRAVAAKLRLGAFGSGAPVTVVCAGGLLQSPLLFGLLSEQVQAFLPSAQLVYPQMSAADGAALLALDIWRKEQAKQL